MKQRKTHAPGFSQTEIQYSLTYREVVEILSLVRDAGSAGSVEIEIGDLKLRFEKGPLHGTQGSTIQPETRAERADTAQPVRVPDEIRRNPAVATATGELVIKAPMLGTFYRSPEPSAPPFIKEGQVIAPGDTIGLLEVMKLFSPVVADVGGRVVEFLVKNADLVEHGQPLVRLDPVS